MRVPALSHSLSSPFSFAIFVMVVVVDEGGVDDSIVIVNPDPQLKHWTMADDGSGYNATFPRNQAVSSDCLHMFG